MFPSVRFLLVGFMWVLRSVTVCPVVFVVGCCWCCWCWCLLVVVFLLVFVGVGGGVFVGVVVFELWVVFGFSGCWWSGLLVERVK
jgi:hypothetical protein